MTRVRCRESHGVHPVVTDKFKCIKCKRWVCGMCEGPHSTGSDDHVLCDPCWLSKELNIRKDLSGLRLPTSLVKKLR